MSYGFLHIAIAAVLMLAGAGAGFMVAADGPEGLSLVRGIGLSALALYLMLEAFGLRRWLGRPTGAIWAPGLRASSTRLIVSGVLASALALSYLAAIPPAYAGAGPYRDFALLVLAAYVLVEAVAAHRQLREARPEPRAERPTPPAPARPGLAGARAHGLRVAGLAVLGLVLVVLYGTALPPEALPPEWAGYREALVAVVLVLILIDTLVAARRAAAPSLPEAAPVASPQPPRVAEGADYGEVLAFLSLLQDKGRFLDFLMEDIAPYNDAQVAAASRVVHEGCAAVAREYLDISPVHAGQEGDAMTVETGADPNRYRLVGKVAGAPPFRGVVVHCGWKTAKLTLPRYSRPIDRSAPNIITPVEVEVR